MTEQQEHRRKIVAERILRNLAHSPRHAHMGALARIDKAYAMADEIMSAPVDEEAPANPFPGLDPDGFLTDQD